MPLSTFPKPVDVEFLRGYAEGLRVAMNYSGRASGLRGELIQTESLIEDIERAAERARVLDAAMDQTEKTVPCICGEPILHCILGDHWHHVTQPTKFDHWPTPEERTA